MNGSSLFSARHLWLWIAVCFAVASGPSALALDITGYTATVNDRFTSGFPTAPVPNTNPSFIGDDYDWSGVGWASTDGTKGFGFITPQHYLVARHYGGAATIRLTSPDGTLRTATQAAVTDTNYGVIFSGQTVGDLSIGRLTASMPSTWQIARYAVLDLNASSSINNSYNGAPLLVYGRGADGSSSPRIGAATINGTTLSGLTSQVTSAYTDVKLQTGDSGSPIFIPWTNPNGVSELTILGNNAGTDFSTINAYNYFANSTVMGVINGLTTPQGFALRLTGSVSNTWVGSSSTNLSNRGAWGLSAPASAPSDVYVLFNGTTAGNDRAVSVDANRSLRGLSFQSTNSGTLGFTFGGLSTLTVGRGGITNYDTSRQTFTANLTLGDHQYWDVGPGGVTAAAINTNGKLLEIAGSGTARITGLVSGTGGLALSGHRLELTGSSSYTGNTWVHSGTLVVNGNIAASSGVAVDAGAVLGGSGSVGALSGAGAVGPGNSPGILTAPSVDPLGGLDFSFELTGTGMPNWANATASVNDVLRLTSSSTPFTSSLSVANGIDIFFSAATLSRGDTFLGGFFTDMSGNFLPSVQNAAFSYYVFGDGAGTDKTYNNQGYYLLDTDFWAYFDRVDVTTVAVATANFSSGDVTNGRVMQFVVVPEPGAIMLAAMGVAIVIAGRRNRRL